MPHEEVAQQAVEHAIHATMPLWACAPFAILLVLIAIGPLFFHHFWEHHYPKVSIALGAIAAGILFWVMPEHAWHRIGHSMLEYYDFLALIGSLFVISGGILIKIQGRSTAGANTAILATGAALSNLVGTTGASMLLIRPFLRFNRHRFSPHLVVFFIFIVSNVGGALTPIGDPPLFLGYLKGVPFFWMLDHATIYWLLIMGIMLGMFWVVDRPEARRSPSDKVPFDIQLRGVQQIAFLVAILALVLIQKAHFLHAVPHWIIGLADGTLMIVVAAISYKVAEKDILRENEFNFGPLWEVGLLFFGIFLTMIPALEYLGQNAEHLGVKEPWQFFIATGLFSAVLDNAPTFLTFLSMELGLVHLDINNATAVPELLATADGSAVVLAISLGAVFWGAMTYIGNGPNFMVRNIAMQAGVPCPNFVEYVYKYSVPFLLPVLLLLAWLLSL